MQRFGAQRRRDLRLADQVEVDRQGTALQEAGQVLCVSDAVEAARDLSAGAAVDPVRVLRVIDDRPRLDFVVEHDGEMAGGRFGGFFAARPDRRGGAALSALASY